MTRKGGIVSLLKEYAGKAVELRIGIIFKLAMSCTALAVKVINVLFRRVPKRIISLREFKFEGVSVTNITTPVKWGFGYPPFKVITSSLVLILELSCKLI